MRWKENGRPVRLIAVDMDGTLLGPDGAIPEENVRALTDAQRAGIAVCINTGRLLEDAADHARRAGLRCMIAGLNGARILDEEGRMLHSVNIPGEESIKLCETLLKSGLRLNGFFDGNVVTVLTDEPWEYQGVRRRLVHCRYGAQALLEHASEGMCKIVAMGTAYDPRLKTLRYQVRAQFPDLAIASSWNDNIEIGPAGTGKGEALRTLCEKLNISITQAMAIGDEENDLPMLEIAGYAVAMGNATAQVKQACRYQTTDNAHAGVARAVRRIALEGKDSTLED